MFSDPDPIECDMGVRVEDMDPYQLVAYFKTYHAAFGLDMAVEGIQERAIFRALQRIYGQATAGQIVKWVTYHHKGHWEGKPVRFASFCRARKWWVDIMHTELQAQQRKEQEPLPEPVTPGVRVIQL